VYKELPSIESIMGNIQMPTISIPRMDIPNIGNSNISNNSDSLNLGGISIIIQGNADSSTIDKLKTEVSDAVINKIYQQRYKQGFRHKQYIIKSRFYCLGFSFVTEVKNV
jgi:hypothetical protein